MRLAKLFVKMFLQPSKKRTIRLRNGIVMDLPNLIENLSLELFVNGRYEEELVDYLVQSLPAKCSFIDVGANIGAISVFVASKRKDVSVYAIEASSVLMGYLKNNIGLNDLKNIVPIHKAVYSVGEISLDFFSPKEKFGKGSLAPVFTERKESVETIRLDSFLKKYGIVPACIKIDVEGFEYFVIDSLEGCFRDSIRPTIVFEFVDWAEKASSAEYVGAAQSRLMSAGYHLYDFNEFVRNSQVPITTAVTKGSRELIGVPA